MDTNERIERLERVVEALMEEVKVMKEMVHYHHGSTPPPRRIYGPDNHDYQPSKWLCPSCKKPLNDTSPCLDPNCPFRVSGAMYK
jgi:hypothetical protein